MRAVNNGFLILDHFDGFKWSSNEHATSYEVARESISGAIGAYSARIACEMRANDSSADLITSDKAARSELAHLLRNLDPDDVVEVANIREKYSRIAQDVRSDIMKRIVN